MYEYTPCVLYTLYCVETDGMRERETDTAHKRHTLSQCCSLHISYTCIYTQKQYSTQRARDRVCARVCMYRVPSVYFQAEHTIEIHAMMMMEQHIDAQAYTAVFSSVSNRKYIDMLARTHSLIRNLNSLTVTLCKRKRK